MENGYSSDPPNGVPIINVEKENLLFYESDEIRADCEIEDGLPSANMSWMFTPLPHLTQSVTVVDNKQRISLIVNVNRTMDQQKLSCKANHFAWLDNPDKITHTDKIAVYCKHLFIPNLLLIMICLSFTTLLIYI